MTLYFEELKDALKYNKDLIYIGMPSHNVLCQIKKAADSLNKRSFFLTPIEFNNIEKKKWMDKINEETKKHSQLLILDLSRFTLDEHIEYMKQLLDNAKNNSMQIAIKMLYQDTSRPNSCLAFYKDREIIESIDKKYKESCEKADEKINQLRKKLGW